jgi:hypothetical protein
MAHWSRSCRETTVSLKKLLAAGKPSGPGSTLLKSNYFFKYRFQHRIKVRYIYFPLTNCKKMKREIWRGGMLATPATENTCGEIKPKVNLNKALTHTFLSNTICIRVWKLRFNVHTRSYLRQWPQWAVSFATQYPLDRRLIEKKLVGNQKRK